jgi:hypothetical protein
MLLSSMWFLNSIILSVFLVHAQSVLVTKSAGRVMDHVVTTREVLINSLIEDVLYRPKAPRAIHAVSMKDRAYLRETSAVLLEWAIYYDGKTEKQVNISDKEVDLAIKRAEKTLRKNQAWQEAMVESSELRDVIIRKLKVKSLIDAHMALFTPVITDSDAKNYFEENKYKFSNLQFESLRPNIKAFLQKEQSDERMREWFELLQIKYKVRNFLADKMK